MGVGTVARILTVASLIVLLLDLRVELPELNLAALGLIFALGLHKLILQLLLLLHKLGILRLELLEVGLGDSQRIVDSGYFTLLLVEDADEVVLYLLLGLFEFLLHLSPQVFFLLLELLDSFVEHLDVQLELLLYFDVVADLRLVLLQLLFILFRRQVDRFES